MQTLATLTLQCDVFVAEECQDEVVHARLLESASFTSNACERGRALDILLQEVGDVYSNSLRTPTAMEFKDSAPRLPSSPQMNRPGTHLQSMCSHS